MTWSAMFPSYEVFGAKITPTTKYDLVEIAARHIEAGRGCVIAYQNLHGLYVSRSDAQFRELHVRPDTYVHVDGMPIVWLGRLAGLDVLPEHRVTLVDWIWPLLEAAARGGWRVYSLGGSEAVADAGRSAILRRLPALDLRGHNGYFSENDVEANAAIVDEIQSFEPNLIIVGMGMGRQERWILKHADELGETVIVNVGACMEYLAGAVRTPPRWMGRAGLEWLFRLGENPRRFAYRYTVEPFIVFASIASWLFRDRFSRDRR